MLKQKLKIIFFIFIMLYIIESIYLSFMLNAVVNQSYANCGLNNPFANIVDDEDFYRLCNRHRCITGPPENTDNIVEKYNKTFPFIFHWFTGGKAVYVYTYEIRENDKLIGGSWHVPVWITMDFNSSPWVVKVYEAP